MVNLWGRSYEFQKVCRITGKWSKKLDSGSQKNKSVGHVKGPQIQNLWISTGRVKVWSKYRITKVMLAGEIEMLRPQTNCSPNETRDTYWLIFLWPQYSITGHTSRGLYSWNQIFLSSGDAIGSLSVWGHRPSAIWWFMTMCVLKWGQLINCSADVVKDWTAKQITQWDKGYSILSSPIFANISMINAFWWTWPAFVVFLCWALSQGKFICSLLQLWNSVSAALYGLDESLPGIVR